MVKASDLLVCVLVVCAVVWLDLPTLIVPAVVVTLAVAAAYRWRREGQQPFAVDRYRWRLVASCVLIAAISVPLILRIVPPNGAYGFRTHLTRSSAAIWYPANAFLGWALLVAAGVSASALIRLPSTTTRWLVLFTFLAPLLAAVVASFIYLERFA